MIETTTPADSSATLGPNSLRTLLRETMFRAAADEAYVINRGEPGLIDTLRSLSAEVASTPPGPGRKPIVSHANHVLFGLELAGRAIDGDMKAFEGADWDDAWKLEQVDDAEWADLLRRLEAQAEHLLQEGPTYEHWNAMVLTGMFGIAAHTAYHLGAVRQMLRDLQAAE